jgi:hypothetical protein
VRQRHQPFPIAIEREDGRHFRSVCHRIKTH